MLAILSQTQPRSKSVQLRLLASCAIASAIFAGGSTRAAVSGPPPITGADTSFQGIATPSGTGTFVITQTPTVDTITVSTANTVINFTPFDTATGGGPIVFLPSGRTGVFVNDPNAVTGNFTVLNRIVPTDLTRAIRFDGTIQSRIATSTSSTPGGNIWFYSPGGIIASSTSVFDVGSLVLTALDVNTTGGLFGPSGEIRFSGAPGSTSAINIMAGAQITARGQGAYVALVAPQIIQSGIVKSDGSVGYIAGEAVDVRIHDNLFDINFSQGTGVATAINHNGTTALTPGGGSAIAPQRAYVAAVAKNDAITSLVSGNFIYVSAESATVQNGQIILTAGNSVTDSLTGPAFTPAGGTGLASISIGADTSKDSLFATSVIANARGNILIAPQNGHSATFSQNVSLTADRLAEVRAASGSSTLFDKNVSVISNNLAADAAARVIAQGNTGYGSGYGSGYGTIGIGGDLTINGGLGKSATATLAADGGHIAVTGIARVEASTELFANETGDNDAAAGTATLRIGAAGSQLSALGFEIYARATAAPGGNAVGGNANLVLGGGTITAENAIALDVSTAAFVGSTATGGTVSITSTGGVANLGTISANADTRLNRRNTEADRTPAPDSPFAAQAVQTTPSPAITGGTVIFDLTSTAFTAVGDVVLNANATGSTATGDVLGGNISVNIDSGSIFTANLLSANAAATANEIGRAHV